MKRIISGLLCLLALNISAQDDKTVTLVASGQGKTQDEAKQNALRSAIEQAFGTFISSKTEILNDNLVKDEIVSVANGNIQKFEVLSILHEPNQNLHFVSLNATVSLDKLVTFVQSKGFNDVSFNGSAFSMNIKVQKLNESSEIVAIQNLLEQGLGITEKIFDRELNVGNPKLEPSDKVTNPKYQIMLTVSTKINSNWDNFYDYFNKTISKIAMSTEEIATYKEMNKSVYLLLEYMPIKDSVDYFNRPIIRKDSLRFRTAESLANLTSFYILLNARYLDGIKIVHDIDSVSLDIKYDAKYPINMLESDHRLYRPNNLWYFDEIPFDFNLLLNDYNYTLSRCLIPIFKFCTYYGERIPVYEFEHDKEFYSPLYASINSHNMYLAAKNISEQILQKCKTHVLLFDFSKELLSGKKLFAIKNTKQKTYNISINVAFTEDELQKINGFKLLNKSPQ